MHTLWGDSVVFRHSLKIASCMGVVYTPNSSLHCYMRMLEWYKNKIFKQGIEITEKAKKQEGIAGW